MDTLSLPICEPVEAAADTWLIPNLLPAGPDAYVPINSMLIRGTEPVLVDTGAVVHRDRWFDLVFTLVEPDDVRWVFVSHEEADHLGNCHELLERCPNATLISCFMLGERAAAQRPLPLHRQRWLEPGQSIDVGDRVLQAVRPPLYDAPTTRGLFDPTTEVLWAADCFAAPTPGPVGHAGDVPGDLYDAGFRDFNSLLAPWHALVDRGSFAREVTRVRRLDPSTILSAHGPVLTGAFIDDAFDRVERLAGEPASVPPGQELLDALIAPPALPVTHVAAVVPPRTQLVQ